MKITHQPTESAPAHPRRRATNVKNQRTWIDGARTAFFAGLFLMFGIGLPARAGTCTVSAATTYQTIDGFGFSSAWSGQMTSAQAATFFGTGSGQLGFTLLRVRIDPTQNWSDETVNASTAHSYGATVLGTPWTPPASMKSNDSTIGGTLDTSEYAAYATYLNTAATSIGLDYVSMQNEPDADVDYESCSWTGTNMETWCQTNAPTVARPIVMPESEDFNDAYSDPTLNNSTADNNITIVAGHIYGGGNEVHQNALNHGKHVWMTEHYNNGFDIGTAITDAKEVSDCMNNQMSAYIWWYGFYPGADCDLVNGSTPELNGYALGQFARFVRPGYVRVSTTYNPSTNIYVTAYAKPGAAVIVAINTGTTSASQPFALQDISTSSVTPTVTSASSNMVQGSNISVTSGSFTATLPAQSVTTFVSGSASITYRMVNLNSALSLDAYGAGTSPGTLVDQYTWNGHTNQQWTMVPLSSGGYNIVGVGSGLYVTATNSVEGSQLALETGSGSAAQVWTISAGATAGNYILKNSSTGYVMDDYGNAKTAGTEVDQWAATGGANQEWSFQAP